MKKLYYFSNKTLNYVEIKNFKKKFYTLIFTLSFAISLLLFGGYFLVNAIAKGNSAEISVKEENKILKQRLKDFADSYYELNNQVEKIVGKSNELRIAANLPEISEEERELGTGGGDFFNLFNIKNINTAGNIDVNELSDFIDNIKLKVEFEKENYSEITKKIKLNENLFASIPAIKPSEGVLSTEGFGQRLHPILKINRMHEGIDIITSVGTPVKAPGNGKVSFVGRKGGYGLCIEIDHGFGYKTIYGHLSKAKVKDGQKIKRGDLIAETGNTGLSTGPHLHYEIVHNGIKQDPINFILDDLNIFE